MICEADLLQYAICHKAFNSAVLLLLCGWEGINQHKCSLVLYKPVSEPPQPPHRKDFNTEELCSLYSRSFSSINSTVSNDYANASFILRHWGAISVRLGTLSRSVPCHNL